MRWESDTRGHPAQGSDPNVPREGRSPYYLVLASTVRYEGTRKEKDSTSARHRCGGASAR